MSRKARSNRCESDMGFSFKAKLTRLELAVVIAFHFSLTGTSSDVACLKCSERRVAKLVACSSWWTVYLRLELQNDFVFVVERVFVHTPVAAPVVWWLNTHLYIQIDGEHDYTLSKTTPWDSYPEVIRNWTSFMSTKTWSNDLDARAIWGFKARVNAIQVESLSHSVSPLLRVVEKLVLYLNWPRKLLHALKFRLEPYNYRTVPQTQLRNRGHHGNVRVTWFQAWPWLVSKLLPWWTSDYPILCAQPELVASHKRNLGLFATQLYFSTVLEKERDQRHKLWNWQRAL